MNNLIIACIFPHHFGVRKTLHNSQNVHGYHQNRCIYMYSECRHTWLHIVLFQSCFCQLQQTQYHVFVILWGCLLLKKHCVDFQRVSQCKLKGLLSQKKSRALGLWPALGCFFPCCLWAGSGDGAAFTTRGVLRGRGGDLSSPWVGVLCASNGILGLSFTLRW